MCPYIKYNEKQQMICEPKGDTCLLCVLGNSQRYNEIEQENEQRRNKLWKK